jgi:DNA repair exonuclease SbcCD ATPase subunit
MTRLSYALGVWAVLAATPAAHGGPSDRAHALHLGQSSYVTGMNIEDFVAMRKAQTGDFLWFRRHGKAYVVTDAAVLDAARIALRPVDELGREQQAVSNRLHPYEKREAAIDREEEAIDEAHDALDDRDDAAAETARQRLEARRREVESRRRTLESEMRDVQGEERRLEEREREIERIADEAIERLADDALKRGLARKAR